MEGNTGPPPGGAANPENPDENPRVFQQIDENPSDPQLQTQTPGALQENPSDNQQPSTPLTATPGYTKAPMEGLDFFNTPGDETQSGWDIQTTASGWGTVDRILPKPNSPPPPPPEEDDEDTLMKDAQLWGRPLIQEESIGQQEFIRQTSQQGQDSPTTRVSTGYWGPLPKISKTDDKNPSQTTSTPGVETQNTATLQNPPTQTLDTATPMVTQEAKSPGTQDGSPNLVTPPAKPSPETSPQTKTVSYADQVKGGSGIRNSPLQDTICEIEEDEASVRCPPPTDVTFSAWVDLTKVKLSHASVKKMAAKHPKIKGVGLRKESQWLECYCRSAQNVTYLLENPLEWEENRIEFVKARKINGDRLVLKLANVNPSPDEEVIREGLFKALSTVAQVEKVAPVYLRPEEDSPKEEWLITRR